MGGLCMLFLVTFNFSTPQIPIFKRKIQVFPLSLWQKNSKRRSAYGGTAVVRKYELQRFALYSVTYLGCTVCRCYSY